MFFQHLSSCPSHTIDIAWILKCRGGSGTSISNYIHCTGQEHFGHCKVYVLNNFLKRQNLNQVLFQKCHIFTNSALWDQLGRLGRVGLIVAMSVCVSVCLSVCPLPMRFFSRPLIGTLYISKKPLQHLLATGVPSCEEPGSAHEQTCKISREELPHPIKQRRDELRKRNFFVSLPLRCRLLILVDSCAEWGWPDTLGTIQGVGPQIT